MTKTFLCDTSIIKKEMLEQIKPSIKEVTGKQTIKNTVTHEGREYTTIYDIQCVSHKEYSNLEKIGRGFKGCFAAIAWFCSAGRALKFESVKQLFDKKEFLFHVKKTEEVTFLFFGPKER